MSTSRSPDERPDGAGPAVRAGRDTAPVDAGAVYHLPVRRRHLAIDERGIGLRATWHLDRGFLNLSLWRDDRCVETFHLTPVEVGRLVGFLTTGLADAVPAVDHGSPVAAVPAPAEPSGRDRVGRVSGRLESLRSDVAEALERAANRLRQ